MYRFKDSLDNFRLNIKLRKVVATSRGDTPTTTSEDYEELILKWQEKYYSTFEKELYNMSTTHDRIKRLFTYVDDDHYQDKISLRHSKSNDQYMFVMADLKRHENPEDYDEHMLICISVNKDLGLMSTSHELSYNNNNWYKVINRYQDVFEFNVQHTSQIISEKELINEKQLQSKLYTKCIQRYKFNIADHELDINDTSTHVFVIGSIETAEGFDGNTLYVTVQPQVSDGWSIENNTDLLTTQLCTSHTNGIAHFNCPIEYKFIKSNDCNTTSNLHIEVSSLDKWDRHTIEGYTTANIPHTPGVYNFSLQTVKSNNTSVYDRLMSYFIGGSPRPPNLPKASEATHCSQFGYNTISSGSVTIRLYIIHQSYTVAEKYKAHQNRQYTSLSVQAVSDIYRRVQAKALQVMSEREY